MWDVTMLFIHILAFCCVISIYRGAPCWLQKLAIGLLAASLVLYSGRFCVLLWWGNAALALQLKIVALTMEHLGVLIYVFRIAYKEHIECKRSSQVSPL